MSAKVAVFSPYWAGYTVTTQANEVEASLTVPRIDCRIGKGGVTSDAAIGVSIGGPPGRHGRRSASGRCATAAPSPTTVTTGC